jgi:hypothetical protein
MNENVRKAIERLELGQKACDTAFMMVRLHPILNEDEKHNLGNAVARQYNWMKLAIRWLEKELKEKRTVYIVTDSDCETPVWGVYTSRKSAEQSLEMKYAPDPPPQIEEWEVEERGDLEI